MTDKMEKYHGNTIEHWRLNAEEDYLTTPISVLKYITVLEEQAKQFSQTWIPVSERLPDPSKFVIAHKRNGLVLGLYYNTDNEFMYGREDQTNQVTHWMPLPNAPEQ